MSLATRCAACGTVFRVVQDQLRVSGGWVRCGRCSEVFNAVESLVDLEIDRPADGALPSAHGERVMQDLAQVAGAPAGVQSAGAPADLQSAGAPAAAPLATPPNAPPSMRSEAANEALAASADASPAPLTDASTGLDDATPADLHPDLPDELPLEASDASSGELPAPPEPLPAPAFLRRADRAARWRRPRVRAGLALLALLAAATLAVQLTLNYHDTMAARWPAARALIERFCVVGGCTVEPPRRINSLAVESSSLTRAGPQGAFRLSLLLRNRDSVALRMPSVDLSLTDAQGRTLARRVLDPAQLGARQPSIGAGAEQGLAVSLRTGDPAVVGYTIEIFYP